MATRKPTSSASGNPAWTRPPSVIFYNADLGMVSPAVSDDWPRPIQELVRVSSAIFTTNVPSVACAQFIGWYLNQPGAEAFHLSVDNLPVSVGDHDGGDAGPSADWHDRLMSEVADWAPDAVLVRLDGLTVTQGGRLLWRSDWVQRATGQKFSSVSKRRRAWIARQLTAARRFIEAMSPADSKGPITLDALDRAWAAWLPQLEAKAAATEGDPDSMIAALNPLVDDVTAIRDAVGVQFGQFLVEQAGFEWTVAADALYGTELIVRALPGCGDVLVYPIRFVEQRWYEEETGFLRSSVEAIRDDVAAIAEGRPAMHWPW